MRVRDESFLRSFSRGGAKAERGIGRGRAANLNTAGRPCSNRLNASTERRPAAPRATQGAAAHRRLRDHLLRPANHPKQGAVQCEKEPSLLRTCNACEERGRRIHAVTVYKAGTHEQTDSGQRASKRCVRARSVARLGRSLQQHARTGTPARPARKRSAMHAGDWSSQKHCVARAEGGHCLSKWGWLQAPSLSLATRRRAESTKRAREWQPRVRRRRT